MSLVQYKCPNCGGSLELNAANQNFSCEFCLSEFTEEQLQAAYPDENFSSLDHAEQKADEERTRKAAEDEFAAHTSLYSCPNCGAEIISEDTTAATFCYYCHSPVILSGRLSGDYKPSKVIPFKHDRNMAESAFKSWCGKKWFLPGSFTSAAQLEKLTGVYVPFWLADCKIDANVSALGKKIHTWTSGDTRYTNTKEFSVFRSALVDFDKIPADGSKKTDDKLMEAIEPYNYNELRDFSMSYLSGYLAEKYDVKNLEVFPRIKQRAERAAMEYIRSSMVGYDSIAYTSQKYNVIRTNWHYTLLPVWLMTYKYGGKYYFFAMNGQTGKIAGIMPISIPKLLIMAGIVAIITFLIAFLGGMFL